MKTSKFAVGFLVAEAQLGAALSALDCVPIEALSVRLHRVESSSPKPASLMRYARRKRQKSVRINKKAELDNASLSGAETAIMKAFTKTDEPVSLSEMKKKHQAAGFSKIQSKTLALLKAKGYIHRVGYAQYAARKLPLLNSHREG